MCMPSFLGAKLIVSGAEKNLVVSRETYRYDENTVSHAVHFLRRNVPRVRLTGSYKKKTTLKVGVSLAFADLDPEQLHGMYVSR